MSVKNKKQFGVWMDARNATIIGREDTTGDFVILGRAKNEGQAGNSNENAGNNAERSNLTKYFKEINVHTQNMDELHVTGTGQVQEQFIRFLSESPQFKNVVAKESTSNKMTDEKLLEYFTEQF